MPKSVWGRRCSTPGCLRPRGHDGECACEISLLGDDDEVLDESAKEDLIKSLAQDLVDSHGAGKAPELDKIVEDDEVVRANSSFGASSPTNSALPSFDPAEVPHTRHLGMVMEGLPMAENGDISWADEAPMKPEASTVSISSKQSSSNNLCPSSPTEARTAAVSDALSRLSSTPAMGSRSTDPGAATKAAPDEDEGEELDWLQKYMNELGQMPSSDQLIAFAKNRGGTLTYQNARAMLKRRANTFS